MSADPSGPQWKMDSEEEVVARLHAEGYEHHFVADREGLRCPACHEVADPRGVRIDETYRFEGISNPGDEAVVFAIANGPCGHKGVLATAFGLDMDPDEAEVVRLLGQDPAPEPGADEAPEDDPVTAREAAEQVLIEEGDSEAGAELGDEID